MKLYNIKWYVPFITLFVVLVSCNKSFLERPPLDTVVDELFWQRANDVSQAVNGVYNQLTGFWIRDEGATDNAHAQFPWESFATQLSSGSISTNIAGNWGFSGIRRCNYFLENADRAKDVMDAKLLERFKAEVRFLRVYIYSNLVYKYGDVPLLTKTLALGEVNVPRSPKKEVMDFLIKELEEITDVLPEEYSGGTNNQIGRVTKGAALALKSRFFLYESDWSKAADAAKQVMQMSYSLFSIDSESDLDKVDNYAEWVDFDNEEDEAKFRKALRSYEGLFHQVNEGNSEVIFDRQYILQIDDNTLNRSLLSAETGGWSSVTPTQSMVDAYSNYKTGKPITPVLPEQRAAWYASKAAEFKNEYRNRDPRFYATILFDGAIWNALQDNYIFTWSPGSSNVSQTGYNFRKLVDPSAFRANPMVANHANAILIRYAEVLLNYAEASNEMSGPSTSIYDALDLIRKRSGMPAVDRVVYSNQESLRDFIRSERRVELALEGHRFVDIRRWQTAPTVMRTIYDLNNKVVQNRVWNDRLYLLPVPQTQIDLSKGVLVQNPGY